MNELPNAQSGNNGNESIPKLKQPQDSNIGKVIAIMSGKGGVGKSSVSALLASEFVRKGYKVGLMDADITGPSIPKLFGVENLPEAIGDKMIPQTSKTGVKIMSLNLLLDNEDDPVIWRGPLVSGVVKQFWSDVIWGELDFLFVDLPPGTGDVPLTVLQSLPLDGVVIVSTPQELAEMVVKKAVNMAKMMNVPIFGLVENMGWVQCPNCQERIEPFGPSRAHQIAESMGISLLGALPLDPEISSLGDKGEIEEYKTDSIKTVADVLMSKLES